MKNLRRLIREERLTFGTWMQIPHVAIAEILADIGFDWVCVDLEHGAINIESLADIFRILNRCDVSPVVRVPYNDPTWIHRSLDAGAGGIIVPMIKNCSEARNAVAECKYPPHGDRGFGFSVANMYGNNFKDYIERANNEIAVILQVEHKDILQDLHNIVAMDDVDATFVGPYDLSGTLGHCGDFDHPIVEKALREYMETCSYHKKPAGIHVVEPDRGAVQQAVNQGYRFIAVGIDALFLRSGAKMASIR